MTREPILRFAGLILAISAGIDLAVGHPAWGLIELIVALPTIFADYLTATKP